LPGVKGEENRMACLSPALVDDEGVALRADFHSIVAIG
jgi:hypothetical protein